MTTDPPLGGAHDDTAALRQRAKHGERSAVVRLLELQVEPLRRWAHRRLPAWARSVSDTADLVQDAIVNTLNRFGRINIDERGALGAYMRQAINNRIADELRKVHRRGVTKPIDDDRSESLHPSPFESTAADELDRRYKRALAALKTSDRQLIVGHVEFEYSIDQLACITGRTIGATRMALRRALLRLATKMGDSRV